MAELLNQSLLAAGLYPGYAQQGEPQQTLVLKAGFSFDQFAQVQQVQAEPIVETSQWAAEAGQSTLTQAAETMPFKAGAELTLTGTVVMPHSHFHVHDISLAVNAWQKSLRLFGERHWQGNQLKGQASSPKSFSTLSLCYENSFGGKIDERNCYPLNPIGKGFHRAGERLQQIALPQIEWQDKRLKSARQKIKPACYAPIPLQWTTKLKKLPKGIWQSLAEGKFPKAPLPTNFYNVAPIDQQFKQPFSTTEVINLTGMVKDAGIKKTVSLRMPGVTPFVTFLQAGQTETLTLTCDTLQIDIDQQHIHYLWRVAVPAVLAEDSYFIIAQKKEQADVIAA